MTVQELKEIRKELGMTQKEFAKACGVGRGFISKVEANVSPMTDKIETIALKLVQLKRMME